MTDEARQEIVIIRRGGHGDHDDRHGGVWKIAFADFMTAMMAFFLVMWLISANDKTRASVARYFNPVRLVDATTQPRGLHDPKKDESGVTASPDTKDPATAGGKVEADKPKPASASAQAETSSGREKRLDAALRENPYAALAEITATQGPGDTPMRDAPRAPVIGRRGGDAFRDPFAPPPRSEQRDLADDAKPAREPVPSKRDATLAKSAETQQTSVKAQILASLNGPGHDAAGPRVDVRRTNEGLLVSLTDTADFSMFASGSAVPSRRVVLMMERIAHVLKTKPGSIVVRGYTDNKPFRSGRYDNWHLSLDRAQVTHYMLVRGGLPDARIGHIEGYADRDGRAGVDPANPLNRRIDILLKDSP